MINYFQDFNRLGSASHVNQMEHVVGPLRSGAVYNEVEVSNTGNIDITWNAREPLIIIGLKNSLDEESIEVDANLNPATINQALPKITFSSYSEHGSYLPVHRPGVDSVTKKATLFSLEISAKIIDKNLVKTNIATNELKNYFVIHVIEGIMGVMTYILGQEQQRVRREAREISNMRFLSTARDNALDRIGAEIFVPRFNDEIEYDSINEQVITNTLDINDQPIIESDDDYRRRLNIYRKINIPSKNNIQMMLNGKGEQSDPNTGMLSELGFSQRFELLEQDNDFAFAIHLVSHGSDSVRTNFLKHLRDTYLIAPKLALENNRFISFENKKLQEKLRKRLRKSFNFTNQHYIAPMLAVALDKVSRCRIALLSSPLSKRQVFLAQDDDEGSRYELGLGVDIKAITVSEINELRSLITDPNRVAQSDEIVEGLIQDMAVHAIPDTIEDRFGEWFFRACGIRTIHKINNSRIYLSHLPTSGLLINGVSSVSSGGNVSLEAKYNAPGDPGNNVLLQEALNKSINEWTGDGNAAWVELSAAQSNTKWKNIKVDVTANQVFEDSGLPSISNPNSVFQKLDRVSDELIVTLKLPGDLANDVLSNTNSIVDKLENIKIIFSESGLVSLLPLVTNSDEVLLVVSVIGLSMAGSNLSARRSSGFRWYVVPINGVGGEISSVGSKTVYKTELSDTPALSAIVTIGYVRRPEFTDPYEYRVTLPKDSFLNIRQYEFLMNILNHTYPAGVEVNTYSIRKNHVDLDGDGIANNMSPTISKTYRQFRRPRYRGEVSIDLNMEEVE